MGWCLFASLICIFLCFGTSICLQPNTDGFYVYDFLQKMGGEALTSVTIDTSSSVCSWKGVSCGKGGQEHVIGLVASGVGLHGVIPDDTLGKLNSLQHLDLSGNDISGLSADFWGLGGSLKTLNLSSNKINGSLSSNIGNFGVLESLDLSNNRFDGDLPDAFMSLSNLRVLNLSSNKFYGRFPSGFLGCKSLVVIDLSANELNGSVPYNIGYAFKNLTALSLARNRIRGRMPDFSGLESLTYLNLSGNFFQGPLKGVFHKRLQILDLSSNQFSGHISQVTSSFTSGSVDLVYLDLSENQLSGYFPGDLNNGWSLKHLNLASNRFSRSEFPRVDNLTKLEYLNLSKTSLTGNIPREISDLHNLVVLVLSQNHLTGHIPELSTKNMKVLDLSWNNLTGEISKSLLNKLPVMLKFNFSYNNLTYCSTNISSETLHSAFYGSLNNCPVAVNPAAILGKKRTKHVSLKLVLAIVLSTFCLIVCLFCIALLCRKKTEQLTVKQRSFKDDKNLSGPFSFQTDSTTWVADVEVATSVPVVIFEKPLLNFTFADLLSATSHFDRGTLLADGRFGPVYRGFLPGGIHVAVKVLVNGSTLTDDEAVRELEYLGQIKHPNLVPLTGYCIAGDQRIAIYEYMENGNLQHLLHDLPLGVQAVDDWCNDTWEDDNDDVQSITSEEQTTWRFRHKIALGSARALAFLHYGCFPQIIHRDVKASSIFLDSSLEPRLSDFGLAKIVGSNRECELVRGSPGYTPPEFCGTETCEATSKSDVYGFGVVLFELLTGKKPVGDDYQEEKEANLVSWVRGLVRKNEISKAIDPKIWGTGLEKQMEEAVRIGYLCTADVATKRPSMQQIVGLLKDIEPGVTDQR